MMRTLARLHVITDDTVLQRGGFAEKAHELLRLGHAVALHLRGHATLGGRLYELAARLAPVARDAGSMLLVNDRVDVAMAARASGVQLGRRSLPVARVRALLGSDVPIGCSVHSAEEARTAERGGATFLLVGAIYQTPTHAGESGAGPQLIRAVQQVSTLPIVAIGGITRDNMPEVRAAGAHGIAVIRAVWSSADPVDAARGLLRAMGEGSDDG